MTGGSRWVDRAAVRATRIPSTAGPPPGTWTDWSREDFIKAIDANMLTAVALMQALVPGMMERGWGRVVNITSAAVRSPIGQLGLSNSARSGLTGFCLLYTSDARRRAI